MKEKMGVHRADSTVKETGQGKMPVTNGTE